MKLTIAIFILAAALLNAGEADLSDKLKAAQALAREGDLLGAMPALFAIMRQTANTDLANEAAKAWNISASPARKSSSSTSPP